MLPTLEFVLGPVYGLGRLYSAAMTDTPISFDKPLPESQVSSPYKTYTNKVMGAIIVTSGFMEPHGHGFKSTARKAIFSNGQIRTISPGNYNIGIDYTKGFGSDVTCMYSGTVVRTGREGGYGHRIHIKLDLPFVYEGKVYECFQAYAHCSRLLKTVGQKAAQGETIAIEAGHGSFGPRDYGSHVDLDTYCVINGTTHHINPDLLAGALKPEDIIETMELMKVGTSGLDVRWLQQKLKIQADGQFGNGTKKAVEDFQKSQGDLVVDGIAGEGTCTRLELVGYAVYAKQETVIKALKVQSSELQDPKDKFAFPANNSKEPLLANWVQDDGDHWKFELTTPFNERFNWYVFKPHVEIVKGYDAVITEEEERTGDLAPATAAVSSGTPSAGKWEQALKQCPTEGCLIATAKPEGLSEAGVASSHTIAKKDLTNLTPERIKSLKNASSNFNVPVEIAAALASRESHLGAILGKFGNNPGWGDNNHGWGILQVDKRFWPLKGLDDPYSQAHVEQALGIFASYRDQVRNNHPDWEDKYILKGACVAYNSGVNNVATITGMNKGTTHNDYGDDVIARAQFYQGKIN